MKTSFIIATGLIAMSSASAMAYTPSRGEIDARNRDQLGRIEQGRQSGSITWREGIKLRAEQKRIARTKQLLDRDGSLSRAERRKIDHLQDNALADIRSEKSDGWRRAGWLPRFGR